MERRDVSSVASFFWAEPVAMGTTVNLSDDALQHALVRRLAVGDGVCLQTGRGTVARGTVSSATKRAIAVDVTAVEDVSPPPAMEILVPVADRERMLWAAEKCVELQVTSWRPVLFHRSRSVSPRGEGEKFMEKVVARMRSALEQCGGAWLPEIHPEADLAAALHATGNPGSRIVLDALGASLAGMVPSGAVAVAVGPEGGFEDEERRLMLDQGWRAASLGGTTLRFETAIISAAAVVRAGQLISRS